MPLVDRRAFLAAVAGGTRLTAAYGFACRTAHAEDPVAVATDHPRLFLRPARLRLLRRERERSSARWRQLEALVGGQAPLPEAGFALALYYRISGDEAAGRQVLDFVLHGGGDLRQQALVFDWCQELLKPDAARELGARIQKGIAASAGDRSVSAVRSRILAAVALYDHVEGIPQQELERAVRDWWPAVIAGLAQGRAPVAREDAFPLWEILHAIRDNVLLDLREFRPEFFRDFPIGHLLSYYPAVYAGRENEFRIGASRHLGEPDLRGAAFSRAADLAMVAYDTNAIASQFVQGWLMHDEFMLLGTFGAPYEFLWANPYQPGLSYEHTPLVYHDADQGRLFARSSWEDSATWFGYFEGTAQLFGDGRMTTLDPRQPRPAIDLGKSLICLGIGPSRFRIRVAEDQEVFLLGLEPRQVFQVEIEGQKSIAAGTDPGGTLALSLPQLDNAAIRVRPANR